MRAASWAAAFSAMIWAIPAGAQNNGLAAEFERARVLADDRKYLDALDLLLDILGKDPNNTEAKIQMTTVATRIYEGQKVYLLDQNERQEAVRRAVAVLKQSRARNEQLKRQLELIQSKLDADVGSGAGLLDASAELAKLDREGIENKILHQQLAMYLQTLQDKLHRAISKGVFASSKDLIVARGFQWYYRDEFTQALVLWKEALALDPKDETLRAQARWLERKLRQQQREQTLGNLLGLARDLYGQGRLEEALSQLNALKLLEPSDAAILREMQTLEEKIRQRDIALKTAKAKKLSSSKRPLQAAQAWLEVLTLDPSNAAARAELQAIQKQLTEQPSPAAAPQAKLAAERLPAAKPAPPQRSASEAQQQYALGLIYYYQNDLAKAKKSMEDALSLDPELKAARISLERIKTEVGETP